VARAAEPKYDARTWKEMMMKGICTAALVWGMIQSVALAQVEPTLQELPRWRGFNLLEMFYKGCSTGPLHEEDFQFISELGFNFVRLLLDYRIWIKDGNRMQAGLGNFRGLFGVLDSDRADVPYEDFRGPQARPPDAGPPATIQT
jgi:hypothetical protein